MKALRSGSHLVEHLERLQHHLHHVVVRLQEAVPQEEGQSPLEHRNLIGQDGRGQGRPTAS